MRKRISNTVFPVFSSVFFFSGIVHFVMPEFFLEMMPPFLPFPKVLNGVAGMLEIVIGIGFWTTYRKFAVYTAILLLIVFLFLIHFWHLSIGYFPGFPELSGTFLWLRPFLQLVLIALLWAYKNRPVKKV